MIISPDGLDDICAALRLALAMLCPLWVINRHPAMSASRPLYPDSRLRRMSARAPHVSFTFGCPPGLSTSAAGDDLPRSPPNRLREGGTRHSVIRQQRNQLLNVGVLVVPHLKPERPLLFLICHSTILEQNKNT